MMTARVRKAVFPVAGLGTRFLPATKVMPKEMLTVVDRPLIQHVVEEARDAGIEEFIFVTGPSKSVIEEHFNAHPELEQVLTARGKKAELAELARCQLPKGSVHSVIQEEPLGLGHAVWCARELIGDEPFALLLPDVLVQTQGKNCLAQLLDIYATHGGNIVAVYPVPEDQVQSYGVVALGERDDDVSRIVSLVEKPKPEAAPSNLAILGRYILQPEIFAFLLSRETGAGGEIQITDAMLALLKEQPFYAVECDGRVFDCGSKAGFLAANIAYALERPELRDTVIAEIEKLT
jgi:UTP--glucose-1-phosphate uridylyltransferase